MPHFLVSYYESADYEPDDEQKDEVVEAANLAEAMENVARENPEYVITLGCEVYWFGHWSTVPWNTRAGT